MNRSDKKIRLELIIGTGGVYLTMLLWRLLAPLLTAYLSAAMLQALNIASVFSLTLAPLAVTLVAKDNLSALGFTTRRLPQQILSGILIGLSMGCVLSLLPMSIGLKQLVYTGSGFQSTAEALLRLVYFIFVIGFVEEFIFRGFVYQRLKEICLSDLTPILLSSVLFGLGHFTGLNLARC